MREPMKHKTSMDPSALPVDNLFLIYQYDKRNRSLSSVIRIPKEFVPKLRPKKSGICPSPIKLASTKFSLSKDKTILQLTKDADALSFGEEDDNLESGDTFPSEPNEIENEKKHQKMSDVRGIMNRIRSRTINSKTKDDFSLAPNNFLKDYSGIASDTVLEKLKKKEFEIPAGHRGSFCYWSMQKERASSIINFLEVSSKESEGKSSSS